MCVRNACSRLYKASDKGHVGMHCVFGVLQVGIGVGRWQTPGLHGVAGEVGLKLLETAEACAKLNEMPGFSKHAAQIARARGVERSGRTGT